MSFTRTFFAAIIFLAGLWILVEIYFYPISGLYIENSIEMKILAIMLIFVGVTLWYLRSSRKTYDESRYRY